MIQFFRCLKRAVGSLSAVMSKNFFLPDEDDQRTLRRADRERRRKPTERPDQDDENARRPARQKPRRESRNYRHLMDDEDDE